MSENAHVNDQMHFNAARDTGQNDSLYTTGLAHLQAGEWAEALKCFETLAQKYPDAPTIQAHLKEAQFKAQLDAATKIHARRWAVSWQTVIIRALTIVGILAVVAVCVLVLQRQVAPLIAQTQTERHVAALMAQGDALTQAGSFDAAEAKYQEVLALNPDHPTAQVGLNKAHDARETLQLYRAGVAAQETDDYQTALEKYTQVIVRSPGYQDTSQRIQDTKTQQDLADLVNEAEAAYAAGKDSDAIMKYQQIRDANASFERDMVANRLFELYLRRGRNIITHNPPQMELLSGALDDFSQALALQPRSAEAVGEQRLLSDYLNGQQSYSAGQWDQTISQLQSVIDARPTYLGGKPVVAPLYDAYIHLGDTLRDQQDFAMAWEQYHKAAGLPGVDATLAMGRMDSVKLLLTPTPTPAPTGTATPIPTATPYIYVPPTPLPSATPAPPLATFRNQIVFRSAKKEAPGFWVMNPDGTNRRYLGDTGELEADYDKMYEKESRSPDGKYRVYVTTPEGVKPSPQLFIQGKPDARGIAETWQVTHQPGPNYDPVWSPDGSLIAFVSNAKDSDDIWTVQTDGKQPWNRTPNKWEWDKHPSFSPDSKRIVFWTNREGTKQLYIMDADGKNQQNISKVAWEEYDPLWIK
jgi:tetratricopeptide (TPR) repeat protein